MRQFWPLNIDPLPLDDSPSHEESENYFISFYEGGYGRVTANIYDERRLLIDVITGHSFMEVYNSVREEYPQARWDPERN